jgi:hypothetical protein
MGLYPKRGTLKVNIGGFMGQLAYESFLSTGDRDRYPFFGM